VPCVCEPRRATSRVVSGSTVVVSRHKVLGQREVGSVPTQPVNLSLTRRLLEALVRHVRQGAGPLPSLASLAGGSSSCLSRVVAAPTVGRG
jgi:hypothetical protein